MISNEQIAHDLAVEFVKDGWDSNEVAERNSVNVYLSAYRQFLSDLESQHR